MPTTNINKLRQLTNFPALVEYLRDELDWPIEVEDADEITFEYEPDELGIDPSHAVKIESIKQIRPLVAEQPWGIFFIDFESKRLPVVVLRRILRALVPNSRRQDPNRPVWQMTDLLFISAQGEPGYRSISFAHFQQRPDRPPELRTFSWDSHETHFFYLRNLNLEELRWPPSTNPVVWRNQWSRAFTTEHRYVINKSQELAREMARHARVVRELVDEVYALESDQDPLHQLYDSFKEILLHDLTPAGFADMVAQTVAYGLFSAAMQGRDELTYDHMVELVPSTNPFLKDLLAELTERGGIDLEELGVGQLLDLLRRTDITAILRDFGRQSGSGREDPVIHFYELFLNEYDKTQRVQRGVFYTPDPVVSYIVRSVDYLLKTEFGLEDGLADTTTNPETGEPWVQILDPATGTGTFLAHVIDQIEQTVKAQPDVDWNEYVAEHLLPRLNGFELLMAPYAVAHMKLGLKLRQTGYNFASDERLRIYLSNTLEEPVEKRETLALRGFLSKESNEASRVKKETQITVVLGNPPYSVSSYNSNEWIEGLMNDYKEDVRDEKNIQPLSDDYIKFWRFAHYRVQRSTYGIIGFVTNREFILGRIHRGIRHKMLNGFSSIYILDLHGQVGELLPEQIQDKNVFEIQKGVAITLLVAKEDTEKAKVYYQELYGTREFKYEWLTQHDCSNTHWLQLNPEGTAYYFVPRNEEFKDEYEKWHQIDDIFFHKPVTGFATHRDKFAVEFDLSPLNRRITELVSTDISDDEIRESYGLHDTRDWSLRTARRAIRKYQSIDDYFIQCSYRPFDCRFIFYSDDLLEYSRRSTMKHLFEPNIALITAKIAKNEHYAHVFLTQIPVEKIFLSPKSSNNAYAFPLYLYTNAEEKKNTLFANQEMSREPNFYPRFVNDITIRLDLKFIPHGLGNLTTTLGPEDIFHYIYAVFHSPTYRSRYAEFLKIDFPRLPLTTDLDLFRHLCQLGADLVALHLLEDDYGAAAWNRGSGPPGPPKGGEAVPPSGGVGGISPLQQPITTFVERQTSTTVGSVSKSSAYDQGKVYLDTSAKARSSYFESVPEDVWNFHIGGYQVCHKWLYDRRGSKGKPGRTLTPEDIDHYQRIVVSLQETIRLMEEIDAVIEAHGGWPLVGSGEEDGA